jgi:hypothetical protein
MPGRELLVQNVVKLANSPRLRQAVAGKLRLDWSPEQIAGFAGATSRQLLEEVGVLKSLEHLSFGPVVLVHTQKIGIQSEKPTWTEALEFTQFACGTDPRLLSGEQRTSHFKLVTSVDDRPRTDIGGAATKKNTPALRPGF